jgi:hypothetical protein
MKLRMLVFTVINFGLTFAALAADNYSDLGSTRISLDHHPELNIKDSVR